MTMTSISGAGQVERALEALFRLGANRRFDNAQAGAVGTRVTRAGYAMLRSLSDSPAMTLGVAAAACAMDDATASRQVDRLVADGLVERRSVEGDGRAVELSITGRGAEVYAAIVEHRTRYLAGTLADWSDADLDVLGTMIDRLVADLTRAGRPA